MPARWSAGLLMYRRRNEVLEVFLVHPGGPFWARKDEGSWSIPKGERETDEDPLAAAIREFIEETGFPAEGPFHTLTPVRVGGGKIVEAWCFEGDADPSALRSNTFSLEWPPRSGKLRDFPEVDRGGWFDTSEARTRVVKGQVPLIDELERWRT